VLACYANPLSIKVAGFSATGKNTSTQSTKSREGDGGSGSS
jgi:hypothetical protein